MSDPGCTSEEMVVNIWGKKQEDSPCTQIPICVPKMADPKNLNFSFANTSAPTCYMGCGKNDGGSPAHGEIPECYYQDTGCEKVSKDTWRMVPKNTKDYKYTADGHDPIGGTKTDGIKQRHNISELCYGKDESNPTFAKCVTGYRALCVGNITPTITTPGKTPTITTPGKTPTITTPGKTPTITTPGKTPTKTTPGKTPTKTTPGKTPTTTTKPAPQSQGLTCSNGTLNTDDFDIKKYNGGEFSKSVKTGNGWDTQNKFLCRKNMCIERLRDTSDGNNRTYSCTVPEGQQPSNVSESCCSEYAKKIGYRYQTRSWNDIQTGCVQSVSSGTNDVWFNTNATPSCIGQGEDCKGKTTTKGTFTVVSDEMADCKKKHKGHIENKGSDNINIVIANSSGGSSDQPPHE